jgi:hypothetical protein
MKAKEENMSKSLFQCVVMVLFTGSTFLISCSRKEEPSPLTPSQSVGREYGETLRGAIDQAQGVRNKLEEHATQANEMLRNTEETPKE